MGNGMGGLFNMDNKFFTVMSRVADLMILNIIWIICCLPIVTIGASTTALYYVTMKMVKNEEAYIVKSFFKSFKQNFRQSTIIWLIVLVVGIVFALDLYILLQVDISFENIIRYGIYAMMAIYFLITAYIFPVLAKFYNSIKNTFKNAFFISIRHLPYSIAILAVNIVPMVVVLFVDGAFQYGSLLFILLGFSLIAFCNSYMFIKIFDRYVPEEKEEDEESQLDLDMEEKAENDYIDKSLSETFEYNLGVKKASN